jgi:thiamine kinase-like enzyme
VVGSGFDEKGREVLTYVEGEVIHPGPWSDAAMSKLGMMMRWLHDATASFRVPDNAIWRPWFGREIGEPDIIGHCDAAPWNIIARNGEPFGLVDWEVAGPVNRLTEIAMVAWNNAQLYDDDVAALVGLPDAATRMRQIRLFTDAYGLPAPERHQLAYRIIEFAAQSAANDVVEQQITPQTDYVPVPGIWGIAWRTRSVAWLTRNRRELEAALA